MLQKESMQQQNISAMLGERVTKPRTFTDAIPPMPKRRKADMVGAPLEVPMAKEPVASGNSTVMAQKRKWRLSEVLERDREARKKRTQRTPAFVFLAPHMDSKRPDAGSNQPPLPPPREVRTKKKKGLKQVRFAIDETYPTPSKGLSSSSTCVHIREKSRATEVRRASSVSGGEAILYNRDMLPKSHSLLLNVLIGLESAIALLKTRRTLPTVSAVREIVQRSTKRNFTSQILSQLAHIVPEAIAVVPGISSTTKKKAGLDSYIIRLDDVDFAENSGARTAPEKNGNSVSVLGDSAVRIRRSLLHKRLLAHVKEEHEKFLTNSSISRHDGDLWHEDFDLERDVEELPSPPLYSTCDISPAPSYANGRPPKRVMTFVLSTKIRRRIISLMRKSTHLKKAMTATLMIVFQRVFFTRSVSARTRRRSMPRR